MQPISSSRSPQRIEAGVRPVCTAADIGRTCSGSDQHHLSMIFIIRRHDQLKVVRVQRLDSFRSVELYADLISCLAEADDGAKPLTPTWHVLESQRAQST